MALNIAWGLNKKISVGIFGVWIFGLLQTVDDIVMWCQGQKQRNSEKDRPSKQTTPEPASEKSESNHGEKTGEMAVQ